MQKFLTTPTASFIKVFVSSFLSVVVSLIIANGSLYGINWETLFATAIFSCLPMIVNFLNPQYKGYGNEDNSLSLNQDDAN